MGKLVHVPDVTLDLFIEDEHGSLDSRAPSDELFVRPPSLIRPRGTHLSGRRVCETTAPWEAGPGHAVRPDLTAKLAGIWAAPSRESNG
jgi:hypothetical protein